MNEENESEEMIIWKKVTEKLKPQNLTKQERNEETKKIKHELDFLRNEIFLLFLFFNLAFILSIFLMQIKFDTLKRYSFHWPLCQIKKPIIPDETTNDTTTSTPSPSFLFEDFARYSETHDLTEDDVLFFTLDPLNFVFMAFFLGLLLFQMTGMVLHRVRTLGYHLSRTGWRLQRESGDSSHTNQEDLNQGMRRSPVVELNSELNSEQTRC